MINKHLSIIKIKLTVMKHAFIFGTNIHLSNHKTISYNNGESITVFLTIHTFFNQGNNSDNMLTIEAEINTVDDHHPVKVENNQVTQGNDVNLTVEPNRIRLYHSSHPEPILDVYQLNMHEYKGLTSTILNEIEAQQPDPVFTIKGNFKVSGAHIYIENEKLLIEQDSFANAVENAHNGVILSS